MSAPPYQKFFWGSYHKHTAHLRHAKEHGAYLLLLGALWNNGGRLPADDDTLAAYAMLTTKEWLAIKPKLMPLFRVVRGKLTQPRVTEDLEKYADTSGKRKAAGKTGGTVSARNRKGNGAAIATDLPTKPEPEPEVREQTPIAPKGASTEKPIKLRKADVEAVWSITPKESRERSSRQDVERALIAAARRGHSPDEILHGLAGYFASEGATKDGGSFVKGVHRMIERDRWQVFAEADAPLLAAAEAPKPGDVWVRRIHAYRQNAYWNRLDWGPPPGKPGCTIPDEVLMTAGYLPTPVAKKEVAA